ncbi:MAG: DMT family transporter [Gammaproteobacteria bacterium]|nr:MAG: DMT family transporter [Gammaproteobacteria bacterium]
MSVPVAFLAVVLIWSTTPLAVKWSSEGAGFLPGALGRMGLATLLCVALVIGLRLRLPWHREARYTYAASSLGVYGALLCVYWGALYIPSGLIAVLFGLTPLVTGLFARVVLKERGLTPAKLTGTLLGLAGLAVIFGSGAALGPHAREGIEVVLLGVVLNAAGLVLVKRFNASLPSLATTTGALLVSTPLFLLTWLAFDGHWPAAVPTPALAAIVYLGVVGSVVGFSLYFYVLRRVEASAAALVTLITPVLALLLGAVVNHEPVNARVWTGALLVLAGLVLHQWGQAVLRRWPLAVKAREPE